MVTIGERLGLGIQISHYFLLTINVFVPKFQFQYLIDTARIDKLYFTPNKNFCDYVNF